MDRKATDCMDPGTVRTTVLPRNRSEGFEKTWFFMEEIQETFG
jgi:hypothetical protein